MGCALSSGVHSLEKITRVQIQYLCWGSMSSTLTPEPKVNQTGRLGLVVELWPVLAKLFWAASPGPR